MHGGSLKVISPTASGAVGLPPARPPARPGLPRHRGVRSRPDLAPSVPVSRNRNYSGPAPAAQPAAPHPLTFQSLHRAAAAGSRTLLGQRPPPPSSLALAVATRPRLPPANIPGSHWLALGAGLGGGRGLGSTSSSRRRAASRLLAPWRSGHKPKPWRAFRHPALPLFHSSLVARTTRPPVHAISTPHGLPIARALYNPCSSVSPFPPPRAPLRSVSPTS